MMSIQKAETLLANPKISNEDAFELAGELNQLLSDYMVVYQRLRNFHWNVVGGDFFDVHEKLEEEYDAAIQHIDQIAERMRTLGFRPISTLKGFIEKTQIEEHDKAHEAMEMMNIIVADYKVLASDLHLIVNRALDNKDYGTDFMARNILAHIEKKIWMFQSFTNE